VTGGQTVIRILSVGALLCAVSATTLAQEPPSRCLDLGVPRQAVRDLGGYGLAIVKSPAQLAHLTPKRALILMGWAGATAALLTYDSNLSNRIDPEHSDRQASNIASNVLIGTALGTSTIKYLIGCHNRDVHVRNNAVREWEAMGMSLASVGVLKYAFRRQRPNSFGSQGDFFQTGNTSFPSGHSAVGFAWATTVAAEYPGTFWPWVGYGGAGATSVLRVLARTHWPSDVWVGMTIGYLTGRYLCRDDKCRETPPKSENQFVPVDLPASAPALATARRQFCESIAGSGESSSRCARMDY
jgi:membrane-associated phospholipid phosphatase